MNTHKTTTERLIAVAELFEESPELHEQDVWFDHDSTNFTLLQAIEVEYEDLPSCNTVGCIFGWGVIFSPVSLFEGHDLLTEAGLVGSRYWTKAGTLAFGLEDDLARAISCSYFEPSDLPGFLRKIAELPEGERSVSGMVEAGMKDWHGADLRGVTFSQQNLREADFGGTTMWEAQFKNCNLNYADMSQASIVQATFTDCLLWDSNFECSDLENSSFEYCELTGANFSMASLGGKVTMKGCVLTNANFELASTGYDDEPFALEGYVQDSSGTYVEA